MTAIDPFASVRAGTSTQPTRTQNDQFGKDTFLKLLVAQLRFQNPMAPKDGSEFLAQTAQFTVVEKLSELEKQGKEAARSNQLLAGTTLIGRTVTFADGDDTGGGAVTGVRFDPVHGALLRVGAREIPLTSVLEVHDPTT